MWDFNVSILMEEHLGGGSAGSFMLAEKARPLQAAVSTVSLALHKPAGRATTNTGHGVRQPYFFSHCTVFHRRQTSCLVADLIRGTF